jgi:hypothetical protein
MMHRQNPTTKRKKQGPSHHRWHLVKKIPMKMTLTNFLLFGPAGLKDVLDYVYVFISICQDSLVVNVMVAVW